MITRASPIALDAFERHYRNGITGPWIAGRRIEECPRAGSRQSCEATLLSMKNCGFKDLRPSS
jgi:hypothetical protein